MPKELGSSVVVASSARAHLRQRRTATWTGRCVESMLCRTEEADPEDERSESEAEYDEEDDVEAEVYGTLGLCDEDMTLVY